MSQRADNYSAAAPLAMPDSASSVRSANPSGATCARPYRAVVSTAAASSPVLKPLPGELARTVDGLVEHFASLPADLRAQVMELVADRMAELKLRQAQPRLTVLPPAEPETTGDETDKTGETAGDPDYRAPAQATLAEMRRELHIGRTYAYQHRGELGGWLMGDGPKKRLRFDMSIARAWQRSRLLVQPEPEPEPKPTRGRSRKSHAKPKATASPAGNALVEVPVWNLGC